MEEIKKETKKDAKRVFILILIVIILMISTFSMLGLRKADECVGNPLVYGAETLSKGNNGELLCTCSMLGNPGVQLWFNSTGMYHGSPFLP